MAAGNLGQLYMHPPADLQPLWWEGNTAVFSCLLHAIFMVLRLTQGGSGMKMMAVPLVPSHLKRNSPESCLSLRLTCRLGEVLPLLCNLSGSQCLNIGFTVLYVFAAFFFF